MEMEAVPSSFEPTVPSSGALSPREATLMTVKILLILYIIYTIWFPMPRVQKLLAQPMVKVLAALLIAVLSFVDLSLAILVALVFLATLATSCTVISVANALDKKEKEADAGAMALAEADANTKPETDAMAKADSGAKANAEVEANEIPNASDRIPELKPTPTSCFSSAEPVHLLIDRQRLSDAQTNRLIPSLANADNSDGEDEDDAVYASPNFSDAIIYEL